ncbi:hypothetical protein GGTG_10380 [Gaeumannomyces tritici R3-111a-1]|uniref:Uncharacterized protein n=1 Tax=Gaeumannomyces tritici (strain R3-111a-1) TaxID=644352 RepID=J3PA54_GAET3|nr:hypothetical protein GGTG_10380 [Gaeumannomyces tritici R3-111a-1]EJT71120.1 hypothetical protein GGTG_10380 [Gaeumannomyces tritici R3-111a-1]
MYFSAAVRTALLALLAASQVAAAPLATDNGPAKTAGGRKLLHGPNRHYRWLTSPTLAAEGDRPVYFPGFTHSIYTPVVSETQALWGVAFLLGLLDLPSKLDMETDVATWNVWTRKRYVVQGLKNAYGIYDFISYVNVLLNDLGITVHQRQRSWFDKLFAPTYPTQYTGMQDQFRELVAAKQMRAKLGKARN